MYQLRLKQSSISQLRHWRLLCVKEDCTRISNTQSLREINSGRRVSRFMAKGRKIWS